MNVSSDLPMSSVLERDVISPPASTLTQLSGLIENGLYLQAYELTKPYGPLKTWTGTEARILAGRLAAHLGASKLQSALHILVWRQNRTHPEALYYYAGLRLQRHGPFSTWRFLSQHQDLPEVSLPQQADLWSLWARLYGQVRDFEQATEKINLAIALVPEDPWLWVAQAWLYQKEDRYADALTAARKALDLQPWHRAAVSQVAHLLALTNQNQAALDLLEQASNRFESADICSQYAELQLELGDYEGAQRNFEACIPLSPLGESALQNYWLARVADVAYKAGSLETATAYAQQLLENNEQEQLANSILNRDPEGRRVTLPVEFVRQHHMTCGPATLSTLSRFWGHTFKHLEIAEEICFGGTSNYNSRTWAERNGWCVREFTVTWEGAKSLIDQGIPFAMSTVEPNSAHMQAVIGYDSALKLLLVRDPYRPEIVEFWAEPTFERYRATGPRGMAFVPTEQAETLKTLSLEDADRYEVLHQIQDALARHDRPQAETLCQQLQDTSPDHRLSLEALITLARYDQDQARLLAHINQMLVLFPDQPNWILQKSVCLEELAHREERKALLQHMSTAKDSHPVFWQTYAELLSEDAREADTAARLLKRTIRYMPSDAHSYYLLAQLLWTQRDFDGALELYRFATCLEDTKLQYASAYFQAARYLKQTDRSLSLLQKRWQRDQTQSWQPAYLLAWAYRQLQRPQDMFAVLQTAQKLHPNEGELILYRASLNLAYGDIKTAEALLEQAKGKASETARLKMAAELAQANGQPAKALELWQRVIQVTPLSYEANQAVAKLLAESQGNEVAQDFLAQVCEQCPHSHTLHLLWYEQVQTEDPEQAETVIQRMIANNPGDAWARRQLAWQLGKQHKLEAAFAELELAQSLDPHNAAYFRVKGRLLTLDNRLEESKRAFERSLTLDIDNEWTIRELLSLCRSQAERRAALHFVYQEMTRQVISGQGLLMYRVEAAAVLEHEELLSALRVGLEQRPDLWQAWATVVQQLVVMGQLADAVTLAKQGCDRFPLQVDIWLELAAAYEAQEDKENELEALQQAVQLNPGSSTAVRQLADAYDRANELEKSREILEQAIVFAPLDYRNYGFLASNQWQAEDREAALQTLEKALRLEPDYDWGWAMLERWSTELERPQVQVDLARELTITRAGEALNWLRLAELLTGEETAEERWAAVDRAIQLNPRYTDACDFKARLLAAEQKYDEAIAVCRPSIWGEMLPTVLQGRIAWIEAQRGEFGRAIAQMKSVLEQEPDYYWGWGQISQWYDYTRADAEYLEAAQRLTQLGPEQSIAWGLLGDAQQRTGNLTAATSSFRKALELEPDYRFAGLSLFDLALEEKQLQEAAQTLEILEPHFADDAYVLARQVQLSALEDQKEKAKDALQKLCVHSIDSDWPLPAATQAMIEAQWIVEAQEILYDHLSHPEAHVEVGTSWVNCCIARDRWHDCLKILQTKSLENSAERQAAAQFLQVAGEQRQVTLVEKFLKTSAAALKQHSITWGSVGYCLYTQGKYQQTVEWLSDWEQREGVEPWMLINLTLSLLRLKRHKAAAQVSQKALKLPTDHCSDHHRLWAAMGAAQSGSGIKAARLLEPISVEVLHPSYQALYHLVLAMVRGTRQGAKALRWPKAKEHIQQAIKAQPQLWQSSLFRTCFRQAVWYIARQSRTLTGCVWAYWQCLQQCIRAESQTGWEAEVPAFILLAPLLILGMKMIGYF